MKIQIDKHSANRGSALVITLLTCGILGLLMGSYLYLVQGQRQSAARSQSWNKAIVVAEAGIDEAMALMNSGVLGGNFAVFPWKNAGGGTFTNRPSPAQFPDTNNSSFSSYYTVSIDASGTNPVITSKSYVPAPLSKTPLSRTIRVQTKPRATFPVKGPMIVKETFDSNGNNVATDSFNSNLGPYNPATAGNNGDVVSLTTTPNSVKVGNGKIKGNVRTPPGGVQGVTATIGSNGYVGDAAWLAGGTPGFQPGHFKDDFTMSDFPDVTVPPATWFSPLTSQTAPDGLKYEYMLGNLQTYSMANLNGSLYVSATNTVLYVTDNINISGGGGGGKAPPQIHIGPGASLTIYMAGATTTISGNGVVNDTAQAKNFQYYGLPTNTSINLTGNGSFFGTIYAPQAAFTLKGSGNSSTDDFTGSSITKTTTMTGNFNFHYDDSLAMLTTLGGYDATSWEEL